MNMRFLTLHSAQKKHTVLIAPENPYSECWQHESSDHRRTVSR